MLVDTMTEFLLEESEYIELKNLLKVAGLCSNGAEAKSVIAEGQVTVDGTVELRKACKIRSGQIVKFKTSSISVK